MTPLLAQRLKTERSFERLYHRYAGDVYRYALAVSRNGADAEDVTQTTFLNAYRAVQRGEEPRAPKNWLLAIAHNVLRQRFRQQARRPEQVELDDSVGASVPDEEYTAEDIRRALGELAFNQRAALVMRELEGRSYREIAAILELSVSAVETLIFRARRALREQLETSMTCNAAERAVSLQLDGRLPRTDKGALRAHLRTCSACATLARSQRAQRSAIKGLGAIPLPASITSWFGGGAGTAVVAKAVAAVAATVLVAGGTVEAAKQLRSAPETRAASMPAPAFASLEAYAGAFGAAVPIYVAEWTASRSSRAAPAGEAAIVLVPLRKPAIGAGAEPSAVPDADAPLAPTPFGDPLPPVSGHGTPGDTKPIAPRTAAPGASPGAPPPQRATDDAALATTPAAAGASATHGAANAGADTVAPSDAATAPDDANSPKGPPATPPGQAAKASDDTNTSKGPPASPPGQAAKAGSDAGTPKPSPADAQKGPAADPPGQQQDKGAKPNPTTPEAATPPSRPDTPKPQEPPGQAAQPSPGPPADTPASPPPGTGRP
jgi:RNA polymerase sigma-70 factor, ECF subfamily